jgi:hypothetical protein
MAATLKVAAILPQVLLLKIAGILRTAPKQSLVFNFQLPLY